MFDGLNSLNLQKVVFATPDPELLTSVLAQSPLKTLKLVQKVMVANPMVDNIFTALKDNKCRLETLCFTDSEMSAKDL